ncbi:MAG: DUF4347 domain-containing protein [Burkholderiaceae bacterium]
MDQDSKAPPATGPAIGRGSLRAAAGPDRGPSVETLEPRVLYSADPLGAGLDVLAPGTNDAAQALVVDAADTATPNAVAASPSVEVRRELVFVDADVPDAEALVAAIVGESAGTYEIVLLEAGTDPVDQIGERLAAGAAASAVHLVAHGEPGALLLGGQRFDLAAFEARADALAGWAGSLTEAADILLYGCDLAADDAGRELLAGLARLTGADVAGSDDRTGATALGGDWTLEVAAGSIETISLGAQSLDPAPGARAAEAAATVSLWQHTLETLTVTTANDAVDGDTTSIDALLADKGSDGKISLREAVLAANATAGADIIVLDGRDFKLNGPTGTGEDAAATGDLDITDDLTIRGVFGSTKLNGDHRDRTLDVMSGATLVLEDLRVQNGEVTDENGGNIRVNAGARLVTSRVEIQNGDALGNGNGDLQRPRHAGPGGHHDQGPRRRPGRRWHLQRRGHGPDRPGHVRQQRRRRQWRRPLPERGKPGDFDQELHVLVQLRGRRRRRDRHPGRGERLSFDDREQLGRRRRRGLSHRRQRLGHARHEHRRQQRGRQQRRRRDLGRLQHRLGKHARAQRGPRSLVDRSQAREPGRQRRLHAHRRPALGQPRDR